MPSPSLLTAAAILTGFLATFAALAPVFRADQSRMVGTSAPIDLTSLTLMGFGASLVLGVAGSVLWLGANWS